MKQPPEDLAQKLIDASSQFGGTGLDVSMDQVAQAADVPRATLYYYFSGKEDIVDFYLSHKLDSVSVAMEKAAASEGTVIDRIGEVVRAVLHAMAAQPALCTELPEALRRARAHFSEVAMKAETVMRRPLRNLLIEGQANSELNVEDIEVAIDAIHGALSQVALVRLTQDGALDADGVADTLIPLITSGISASN
jgi:AcrR family transcriptional regulator